MPRVYRDVRTLAVSESTRREMVPSSAGASRCEIVHNGADAPAPSRRPARSRTGSLVLGRLATHKRIDLVLRAVAGSSPSGRRCALDVVGKGPEESGCAALVARAGAGRARPAARLPRRGRQAVGCWAGRSFHVCASDAEGWGQVVIEAAAYGLPTLARDVPGLRDSIRPGETGWLVDTAGLDEAGVVNGLVAGIREASQELEDDALRERRTQRAAVRGPTGSAGSGCTAW